MRVQAIEFDQQHKALELYQTYRAHRGAHTKEDAEIERIYYQISRGRKVIRAMDSVRSAGLNAEGLPKMALIRADAKRCGMRSRSDKVEFFDRDSRKYLTVPWPDMHWNSAMNAAEAMVPLIPVHLRPAHGLAKYHILWEADWKKVPVDPMLLRRIRADLWLVVAAWELTAVEQAVLAGWL